MCGKDENIVWVAAFGLSDDVIPGLISIVSPSLGAVGTSASSNLRGPILHNRHNVDVGFDGCPAVNSSEKGCSLGKGKARCGDIRALGTRRCTECTSECGFINVVVDKGSVSTCSTSKSGLQSKLASAT